MIRFAPQTLAAAAAAALLAACASMPSPGPAPARAAASSAAPTPPATPARERIRRAASFLGRGKAELARLELNTLLSEQPNNLTAKSLLQQIDRDPRALLGERNFSYKVRPGETLSILAERFLGDRLLFYALARYNGIDTPDAPVAGRTVLIPGTAPKPAYSPPRVVAVPRRPTPAAPTATAAAAAPAASPPAAANTNAARAVALRRAALEHMSRGTVNQAVALLQQAAPLDPANPTIRSDLDRALRIQASVNRR